MPGVYRIYLGHGWLADSRKEALLALLDAMPGFLYEATVLSDAEIAEATAAQARRAAVRIGVTQSHVLILPNDALTVSPDWTADEIEVARMGLRHRLPVLVVEAPGETKSPSLLTEVAGLVVPWSSEAVACGVQQLVEAAAGARRKAMRRLEGAAMSMASSDEQHALDDAADGRANDQRALPTEEIELAYRLFKARAGGAA